MVKQSEQGKQRLRLFLILVAVVILGVTLLVVALSGNSASDEFEYDSETVQNAVLEERQAEQAQRVKEEQQRRNSDALYVSEEYQMFEAIVEWMPSMVTLSVVFMLVFFFVKVSRVWKRDD